MRDAESMHVRERRAHLRARGSGAWPQEPLPTCQTVTPEACQIGARLSPLAASEIVRHAYAYAYACSTGVARVWSQSVMPSERI